MRGRRGWFLLVYCLTVLVNAHNVQQWHLVDCAFLPPALPWTENRQMLRPLWQLCLSPSLTFLFFAPSVPVLSDMGNMLSHLGLTERQRHEGRDNPRQRWVEGSSGCRDRKSHAASLMRARTHTCDMSQAQTSVWVPWGWCPFRVTAW